MSDQQKYFRFQQFAQKTTNNNKEPQEKYQLQGKRKVSQLQNKAHFFQGQLNEIISQNRQLKNELVSMRRSVLLSTEILRNLLPIQNDPARKLKVQLAGIQQISVMIKQDWEQLNKQLNQLNQYLHQKESKIYQLQLKLSQTVSSYQAKIQQLTHQHTSIREGLFQKISNLQQKIIDNIQTAKKEKQKLQTKFQTNLEEANQRQKQLNKSLRQQQKKCKYYESLNDGLRNEIAHNFIQFQKSKQNMKQIYSKIMEQKLDEQKESYEMLVTLREQQKQALALQIRQRQEYFQNLLVEKISEINSLSSTIKRYTQQNEKYKGQIENMKISILSKFEQVKNLQYQIRKQKQNLVKLKQQMVAQQKSSRDKIKGLSYKLLQQQKKYQILQQDSTKQFQRSQTQNKRILKELNYINQKLIDTTQNLKTTSEQYQLKLEEQLSKNQLLQNRIKQKQKASNSIIQQINNKLKLKQTQLEETLKRHKLVFLQMEKKYEKQIKCMDEENKKILDKIKSQNEESVNNLIKGHEKMLTEIQLKHKQLIQNLINQQNSKLILQQARIKQLQENSMKSLNDLQKQNFLLQQKCNQSQAALKWQKDEKAKILQMERLRMEQEMKKQMEIFKQQQKNQQADYKSQILQLQKQIRQKELQFKQKILKIRQDMQKQINLLKQNSTFGAMQEKYEQIIQKLKKLMKQQLLQKDYEIAAKIKQLQFDNAAKLKQLQFKHDSQIKKINKQYNQLLTELQKRLQFDLSKLNQDLLNQKQAHEFSILSKQQKIHYLINKITSFKDQLLTKEQLIMDLQINIEKKNKQLAAIQQMIKDKVEQIKNQLEENFNHLMKQKIIQCNTTVKIIKTQRVKHTQQLYEEFQNMKRKNYYEITRLQNKYDELELVFQQRPSRAEDLSKIKQLMEQKVKLDQEMNECKKKVREANQIVRYLNLQFGNYKESFNIFGQSNQSPRARRFSNMKIINETQQENNAYKSLVSEPKIGISSIGSSFIDEYEINSIPIMRQRRERRINTQGQNNRGEFKLLPSLSNKKTIQFGDQTKVQEDLIKKTHTGFTKKTKYDDKSDELKSNAQLFINMLSQHQPVVAQSATNKPLYSRKNKNPHQGNLRRILIKEKSILLKQKP